MDRMAAVKWLGAVAVVVFLGFVAGRQQQLVDSQREILRQLQEIKGSSLPRAAQAPAQPSAAPAPIDFTMNVENAATMGKPEAKVTLVEFSDFECPFCGNYIRQVYSQLERDYVSSGKIRYVFRNFPLERIHPRAMKAGEAGECARIQGKFWPMHDRLFANQKALEPANLLDHARTVGLDTRSFESCLNGQAAPGIRADLDAGVRAGVSGTPTFFLGFTQKDGSVHVVEKIVGAKDYSSFQAVLDHLLASPEAK